MVVMFCRCVFLNFLSKVRVPEVRSNSILVSDQSQKEQKEQEVTVFVPQKRLYHLLEGDGSIAVFGIEPVLSTAHHGVYLLDAGIALNKFWVPLLILFMYR